MLDLDKTVPYALWIDFFHHQQAQAWRAGLEEGEWNGKDLPGPEMEMLTNNT